MVVVEPTIRLEGRKIQETKRETMGAEVEGQENKVNQNPRPNRMTEAQFLSWKRQKVFFLFPFLGFSPSLRPRVLFSHMFFCSPNYLYNHEFTDLFEDLFLSFSMCYLIFP